MATKEKQPKVKKPRDFTAIIGLLQLFVVASIGYTTAVIALGTDGYIPLVLTTPQVLWAVIILIKRFTK
jgi:hypothetical protein